MLPAYPTKVFINDEIFDFQSAKISVFDRGFLFGDSIYEVMVQMNGRFFYGKEHLDRLAGCLQKINIDFAIEAVPEKIDTIGMQYAEIK